MSGDLVAENTALLAKLASVSGDDTAELEALNYLLKKKIAKQQTATGEVADVVGMSPAARKSLKKAFDKYDANGDGMDKAELQNLVNDLAEPLTNDEVAEGMAAIEKAGTISFAQFASWYEAEMDKENHQGFKWKMEGIKLKAAKANTQMKEGLAKTQALSAGYTEDSANEVSIGGIIEQGTCDEAKTKISMVWSSKPEAEGKAAMAAVAAGDAAACLCVNIALLPECDDAAAAELDGMYEQIWNMAEEMFNQVKDQAMIAGKPTIRIVEVDGTKCLQILLQFTADPVAMYGVDTRLIKAINGCLEWAHTADEAIKGPEEEIDLFAFEGLKLSANAKLDRKIVEWIAANEQLMSVMAEGPMGDQFPPVIAAALTFGDASFSLRVKSIMEIFNQNIRDSAAPYNEFLEAYEEKRMMTKEMSIGMVTTKIVEVFCGLDETMQSLYEDMKTKLAGPHSVKVLIPTGEISIDTKGLDCLNKFFPSKAEIEAHESFNSGGGDDDDDEW